MSIWSKSNLSHRRTYIVLRILDQTRRKFSTAGNTKMDKLNFWVPGDSAAIRKAKARSLAISINNILIEPYRSEFEPGLNKTKSVNRLTAVLISSSKKIKDIAEKADECYNFFGEEKL